MFRLLWIFGLVPAAILVPQFALGQPTTLKECKLDLREARMQIRELQLNLKELQFEQKQCKKSKQGVNNSAEFPEELGNMSVLEFVLHHRAVQNRSRDLAERQKMVLQYKKLDKKLKTDFSAYLYFRMLFVTNPGDKRLDKDLARSWNKHKRSPWMSGFYGSTLVDKNKNLNAAISALDVCLKQGPNFPTYEDCKSQRVLALQYRDAIARTKKLRWELEGKGTDKTFAFDRGRQLVAYQEFTNQSHSGEDSQFQKEMANQKPTFQLLNNEHEQFLGRTFTLRGNGKHTLVVPLTNGTEAPIFSVLPGRYSKKTHFVVALEDEQYQRVFVIFKRSAATKLFGQLKNAKAGVPLVVKAKASGHKGITYFDGISSRRATPEELRRLKKQITFQYRVASALKELPRAGFGVEISIEHLSLKEPALNHTGFVGGSIV